MVSATRSSLSIAIVACFPLCCSSFLTSDPTSRPRLVHSRKLDIDTTLWSPLSASPSPLYSSDTDEPFHSSSGLPHYHRRSFIANYFAAAIGVTIFAVPFNEAIAASPEELLDQIKQAREQLDTIPDLIKAEKWDAGKFYICLISFTYMSPDDSTFVTTHSHVHVVFSVRAVLVKPPLSDLWTNRGSQKVLTDYAEAIDEIEALELREDIISHLRYLDMAVYNNVFNPIATEGTTGATKELVRSYYEDPTIEWKACKTALDELIGLAPP